MVDELEHKHEVKVQEREGRQKLPDDVKNILKGSGTVSYTHLTLPTIYSV